MVYWVRKLFPSHLRLHRSARVPKQAFEKCLGVYQVSGAEAFCELIINRLQQCHGFLAAALPLPEAHKIACRAKLPGKGLLVPSSLQALNEQTLDFAGCEAPGRLQQASLDPQHLPDGPAFTGFVRNGERFLDCLQRGIVLAYLGVSLGFDREEHW